MIYTRIIFQFSEIDLSQLLYSFWRVGIIMSKLKNKLCINYTIYNTEYKNPYINFYFQASGCFSLPAMDFATSERAHLVAS